MRAVFSLIVLCDRRSRYFLLFQVPVSRQLASPMAWTTMHADALLHLHRFSHEPTLPQPA